MMNDQERSKDLFVEEFLVSLSFFFLLSELSLLSADSFCLLELKDHVLFGSLLDLRVRVSLDDLQRFKKRERMKKKERDDRTGKETVVLIHQFVRSRDLLKQERHVLGRFGGDGLDVSLFLTTSAT